jgi:hypothetical protein
MNATNAILLIAATGVVLTVIKWAFLAERRLPRNRVRHMRIRLRLRLPPGKGQATVGELWWRWGRLAAFRHSRRTRPTFTFSDRLLAPAPEQSVLVGRAHYRHALRLPLDEHAAIFSPPPRRQDRLAGPRITALPGPGPVDDDQARRLRAHRCRPRRARPGARVQPAGRRQCRLHVPVEPARRVRRSGGGDPPRRRVR